MYIFIDESGIHKQDGKSTTALVYVKVEHFEEIDKAILRSEKSLNNDRAFPCLRLSDLFAGLTRAYVTNPDRQEAKKLYCLARNKITIQLMDGQVPGKLFL